MSRPWTWVSNCHQWHIPLWLGWLMWHGCHLSSIKGFFKCVSTYCLGITPYINVSTTKGSLLMCWHYNDVFQTLELYIVNYTTLFNPATSQHTVTIKIITLQIHIIKIWMRHNFTAKWTLYHNKITPSLLRQIIMVILLTERHPKNTKKTNTLSCSQIITERTNFLRDNCSHTF